MDRRTDRHLRILLIDDDPGVREVLSIMLSTLGYAVVQAAGGREGLKLLETGEPVDLVLTDLRMPKMTGWDVVRDVRIRWPDVKIGIITGTPDALWEKREPVDVVIAKPVTVERLHEAIRPFCE